jgi:hypothetical protein
MIPPAVNWFPARLDINCGGRCGWGRNIGLLLGLHDLKIFALVAKLSWLDRGVLAVDRLHLAKQFTIVVDIYRGDVPVTIALIVVHHEHTLLIFGLLRLDCDGLRPVDQPLLHCTSAMRV